MELVNYARFLFDINEHGFEYAVRHTTELGFRHVEFVDGCISSREKPLFFERPWAKDAPSILAECGLDVPCYSVGATVYSGDREYDEGIFRNMCKQVDFAARLGAPMLHHTLNFGLSLSSGAPTYDELLEGTVDMAVRIADYAREKHGITCIYEPQGMYFNGVAGLGKFFDAVSSRCPNVGICGDVGNGYFVDEDEVSIFERFAPYVKHVHLKDYVISDTPIDGKQGFRSRGGRWIYDVPLGAGVVNFARVFELLKGAGYKGQASLEVLEDGEELLAAAALAQSYIDGVK
ncbi:MAG: sugar phosphate isomerase/epimerase [Clostridia bacterium]|nr:sugar phosphate isomerase/epimerase [Clostridia bacterium]